jgi:hypothetical protein
MPLYNFRIVDPGGQTVQQSDSDLHSDVAALQKGHSLRDGHVIEIRKAGAIIAVVTPRGTPWPTIR